MLSNSLNFSRIVVIHYNFFPLCPCSFFSVFKDFVFAALTVCMLQSCLGVDDEMAILRINIHIYIFGYLHNCYSLLTVCKKLSQAFFLHQIENGAEAKETKDGDEKEENSRVVDVTITSSEDTTKSDEMQVFVQDNCTDLSVLV